MEENSMSQTNLDREKNRETVKQLFDFITSSPSPFHAVWNMKQRLESEGYEQLLESQNWELKAGGKYYVIRNGSSILAFRIPKTEFRGFQIMASHSDSPSFKIKENPEMEVEGHYVKLNVEKYGGMLCAPWLDRPLSVAGRLVVREGNRLVTKLVSVDRDLVLIPNLAIHMNREANDGYKYNAQKDMLPLYGMGCEKGTFLKQIAEAAGVHAENIVGSDLFLYNRMEGSIWGAEEEFISIGKLDDLQCAFASLQAFLAAEDGGSIPVHCAFDNEEVGSSTKQGAASTFLLDTLQRINESLGRTNGQYHQALASSFMLSADNAHAVHPNQTDKTCPTNRPYPNGGVVIKYSANQKYTTDGMAAAIFTRICEEAEVPYQTFLNRSDLPGGSTLGNISNTQVALNTVDIGLAQFAMHSPYETGGVKDTDYLIRAAKKFYETSVTEESEGVYQLW
ncbi:MAG: M18 family aminopeptidase [Dorea sp.]